MDLVLAGGRLIDPARGSTGRSTWRSPAAGVAAVGERLPTARAGQALDVAGLLVTPGLIDLHTHVYRLGNTSGVDPIGVAAASAATTLVDAGSTGAGTFAGFLAHVVEPAPCRVPAFLGTPCSPGSSAPWPAWTFRRRCMFAANVLGGRPARAPAPGGLTIWDQGPPRAPRER